MIAPRWVTPDVLDDDEVAALATELSVPHEIARLLLRRGFADVESAKRFLRPRLDHLHDATTMAGLSTAVERLVTAVTSRELIMIHGDYDVDGICSTALMVRTITRLGGNVVPFIPNRMTDGYDLGAAGVARAIEIGARVVVTCDCGTSALEPAAALVAAGIDVVITDHHLPRGELPPSIAVLNPRRDGCGYPDKDLAAVGVAFKLALALVAAMGASDAFVWKMMDLVALATIADVAALRGENRVLVRYGLKMIADTENVGLRALLRSSGMDGKTLTAGRIGFTLAPRLNAAGRIGDALRGVRLLTTDDAHEANVIARELEELNGRRQTLDRATLEQAREMALALPEDDTFGIVLASEGWHPGVIGIVASRIVEEFARPTLLIALDGDTGKGSGRSIAGFDLHSALGECGDLLLRFGGHRSAAGITIETARVSDFAARFNDVARSRLTRDQLRPDLRVDAEIPLERATLDLESVLRHFEPFGVGNPSPVFFVRDVTVAARPRIVGRDGLKIRLLGRDGSELDAIGWGMAHRAAELEPGKPFDVAFRLERDEYRGESTLQARIADFVTR